ncbi:hypothetical protein Tco_1434335 [Tanacetum coccineum]
MWGVGFRLVTGLEGCGGVNELVFKGKRRLSQKGTNLFSFVKKVGNGEDASFWEDRWLSDLILKHLYPIVFRLELEKHVTVASKLRDMSLISSFRRSPRGGIKEDQFQVLRASVAHILLPQISDRWVWNLESSGDFSVKSARS